MGNPLHGALAQDRLDIGRALQHLPRRLVAQLEERPGEYRQGNAQHHQPDRRPDHLHGQQLTMPRPVNRPCGRSSTWRVVRTADPSGLVATRTGSGCSASSGRRQNTRFQTRAKASSVSSEVTMLPPPAPRQSECPGPRLPAPGRSCPGSRRTAGSGQVHGRHEEQDGQHRRQLGQAAQPVHVGGAAAAFNQAGHQEQAGLHRDVVRHVVDRCAQPHDRGHRQPEHHVADVADQGKREHPLDVDLGHGAQDADQHGQHGHHHQEVLQAAAREQQRLVRISA